MSALLRKSQKLLGILEKGDRKKVFFIAIAQIALSVLDLLGVAAVGLLGAISINGNEGGLLDSRVEVILSMTGLNSKSYFIQIYFFFIKEHFIIIKYFFYFF